MNSIERLVERFVELQYPNLYTPTIRELKEEIVLQIINGELEPGVIRSWIRELEENVE